eukprot:scaffold9548_cov77-Cyclotella_meneghiniana.AAC.3
MSPFRRLYTRIYPSPALVAAGATTIATAQIVNLLESNKAHAESKPDRDIKDRSHYFDVQPTTYATSPSKWTTKRNATSVGTPIECDYLVVGNGRAGQSAVSTLRSLDPSADIVVVDPMHRSKDDDKTKRTRKSGSTQYLPTRATFIEHSQRIVRIAPIPSSDSESQSCNVHYRKAMLISTGSRGAPPPDECILPECKSRILELKSTSVPNFDNKDSGYRKNQQLPILDPATVRSLSLMAASQGATVAVLGSGFEALELAASLARVAGKRTNDDDEKKVLLLFGNSGPLSTRLPRYLSSAISKRLRQCGICVEERSMTRYLSMENSSQIPRLEIYTVKSYDRLDSLRLVADLCVLAPNVTGLNGTAVLPTTKESLTETSSDNYLPWSSLITPKLLTCYLEDGRVATNSELLAASSIYAAGSVAKYPNGRTGQADMAGGDRMSAELSGEIVARNMVKHSAGQTESRSEIDLMPSHVQESIPVWRSDQVSYLPNDEIEQTSTLALYSMGIHALCIGKCDSISMATHGFWWTNTNTTPSDSRGSKDAVSDTSENKVRPNSFMRRMTRRATNFTSKSTFTRGGSLPVYGSGVVYYLDQCGSIQGVMLWGLPFSQDSSNIQSGINDSLVDRMKEIIRTNGRVIIRDHSEIIQKDSYGVTMDVDLLSYLHLSEESKHLASMALTGSVERTTNMPKKMVLGRPLHRYTPWKQSELNLGKLRRKDDMGQVAGVHDLFYANSHGAITSLIPNEKETIRPPSLKRIYTMRGEPTWDTSAEATSLQQERSRPPKEDPIWLRQTEEWRFVNKKETMTNEFIANMLSGQFSDGSEAVKQAPVPKVYLDAKERIKSWTVDTVPEEEDEETE